MSSTDVVRARIDGQVKQQATDVLAQMGLSVSDAIRMMLIRVATDRVLPFDINVAKDHGDTAKTGRDAVRKQTHGRR